MNVIKKIIILCAFGIPWSVAIILCLNINHKLYDYTALVLSVNETCYWADAPFVQADYYIPNVVEYQVRQTLISNTSIILENNSLKSYKRNTLSSGLAFPVVGVLSYVNYPTDSSCMNSDKYYHDTSLSILIIWTVWIVTIILSPICACSMMYYVLKQKKEDTSISNNALLTNDHTML